MSTRAAVSLPLFLSTQMKRHYEGGSKLVGSFGLQINLEINAKQIRNSVIYVSLN